jgi:hypothetical protein
MKKILMIIILGAMSFASYSQVIVAPIGILPNAEQAPTYNLDDARTCSELYYYKRVNLMSVLENPVNVALAGTPPMLVIAVASAASPFSLLVYPAMASIGIYRAISRNTYSNAEELFNASEICINTGECEYQSLYLLKKELNSDGKDLSIIEIADFLSAENKNVEICRDGVNIFGMTKAKKFKKLSRHISEQI